MKLADWARKNGITYVTAFNWFKSGKLPVKAYQTATRTILVEETPISQLQNNKAFIYCRASSSNKKDDLERQVERCQAFCLARGYEIEHITKEIASGMNDKRPKLYKLLEKQPRILVVEHKDRLTRFGFTYFEYFLKKLDCELVVINRDTEEKDDLIKDLVSVITSFCCRLYGMRRGNAKKIKIKEILETENDQID